MSSLTIRKLAKQTETHIETIRYYERIQLIPKPERTAHGYRIYTQDFVKRLHFIKQAKELGFTLEETKSFLELEISDSASCEKVKQKIKIKLTEVKEKMDWLSRIKNSLQVVREKCDQKGVQGCPFLEELEG